MSGTPTSRLRADLGTPRPRQRRPGDVQNRAWAVPRQPRSSFQAPSAYRAPSNTLVERFFAVFVLSCESSKLEIRAPTQCFVRVGGSRESGGTSGDGARKSMHFGFQSIENRSKIEVQTRKIEIARPARAPMRAQGSRIEPVGPDRARQGGPGRWAGRPWSPQLGKLDRVSSNFVID